MKKIIPAIIAIALILIVVGVNFGAKIIERFSYSKEEQNLEEYYGLTEASEDAVAIVLQDELIDTQAKLMGGKCYLELGAVQSLLNSRFYYDYNEGLLLYTTPNPVPWHAPPRADRRECWGHPGWICSVSYGDTSIRSGSRGRGCSHFILTNSFGGNIDGKLVFIKRAVHHPDARIRNIRLKHRTHAVAFGIGLSRLNDNVKFFFGKIL